MNKKESLMIEGNILNNSGRKKMIKIQDKTSRIEIGMTTRTIIELRTIKEEIIIKKYTIKRNERVQFPYILKKILS